MIQSGETTVTFPFPLTVDGTDVHINGVKLWYGNGSGDGTNSDFAINVNTKVVSFGVNPSVGDVVCIVEAMKMMNEIKSEFSGIVEEIYIDDATPVEFDQPLFKIK